MSKTGLFFGMTMGGVIFHVGKHLLGLPVSLEDMFGGVYWSGATLLASHFLVEPS